MLFTARPTINAITMATVAMPTAVIVITVPMAIVLQTATAAT
jgi:hypothetical protein